MELLIVVAIIGVLIALLFPAAQSIRVQSESARCMSNLSLIGKGFQLFAADNDGLAPASRPWGSSANTEYREAGYSSAFWTGWIAHYIGVHPAASAPSGQPILSAGLKCPAHTRLADQDSIPNTQYGMASAYPRPFWLIHSVANPSRAFLAADVGINGPGSVTRIPASEVHRDPSQMGFHHNGRANALFLDGSVRSLTIDDVPPWAARVGSHPQHEEYAQFWRGYDGVGRRGPTATKPVP